MVSTLPVLALALFSFISLFCLYTDTFLHSIPFRLVFLGSLIFTVITAFLMRSKENEKKDRWALIFSAVVFCYLFFAAAPHFYPLSQRWDGTNYLGLANFLLEEGSHVAVGEHQRTILWTPAENLFSYPWSLPAVFAVFASLFKSNAFYVIHPLFALITALGFYPLVHIMRQKNLSPVTIVVFLTAALTSSGFYNIVMENFWGQAYAFLILCVCAVHVPDIRNTFLRYFLTGLFSFCLYFAYPLLIPVLFYTLAANERKEKKHFLFLVVALICGTLAALPYLLPTMVQNAGRLQMGGGPLFQPLETYVITGLGLLYAVSRFRSRQTNYLFPLVDSLIVFCLLLLAAHYTGQANIYWVWKIFAFLVILIPAACFIQMSELKTMRYILIAVLAAFSLTDIGRYHLFGLEPALGKEDIRFYRSLSREYGLKELPVVMDAYTLNWLNAFEQKIELKPVYDPREFFYIRKGEDLAIWLKNIPMTGGYALIDRKTNEHRGLRVKEAAGNLVLVKW